MMQRRLEPTYEGLKHLNDPRVVPALLGLEPTYEGLKLGELGGRPA